MNNKVKEYVQDIINNFASAAALKNKHFLITGATGLIGTYLAHTLMAMHCRVTVAVRNIDKAMSLFGPYTLSKITYIKWDLNSQIFLPDDLDYIIHAASPTDSKFFVQHPVELINDTLFGLNNLLASAKDTKVQKIVMLSSLEVYGICTADKMLQENETASLDCTNIRSSYAEGKRLMECLCASYASEYNVPVTIGRLGNTFGPGISELDNRVFAQFAKCIVNNTDIILTSKGETKRSYCDLRDAILGILILSINGQPGEAYNIASDDSYISIYELAELFIKDTTNKIIINEQKNTAYLPTIKFGLDTSKLKDIGFKSIGNINSMVGDLLYSFRKE